MDNYLGNITAIKSVDDFNRVADELTAHPEFIKSDAWAVGWAEYGSNENLLCVHFHTVNYRENYRSLAIIAEVCKGHRSDPTGYDQLFTGEILMLLDAYKPFLADTTKRHKNIEAIKVVQKAGDPVFVRINDLQAPPLSVADVYLRLHLLSHRKVQPNTINLDGIFGLLPIVVWTDQGAFDAETFDLDKIEYPRIKVYSVDKFPPMLDFVVPSGVRIADGSRVRLGAYLAEGTTVMHEGFCNFNAGTLGKAMIEGRISAGVVIGAESDLGGGASIMGTLSGGGKEKITIGKRCLIGANAGIGISLGDDCKIEAGLYLTANTHVHRPDGAIVKAIELSSQSGMTFYRDESGKVVVKPTKGQVELNPALHAGFYKTNIHRLFQNKLLYFILKDSFSKSPIRKSGDFINFFLFKGEYFYIFIFGIF